MKNMLKLAAIAVSMALVTSLVACSSGDDDVVDATTPEYLLKAQIDKYVASIGYNQNVSDDEIKSLEKAHEAVVDMLGDCADCLEFYFGTLKWNTREDDISSTSVENLKSELEYLKKYGKEEDFHKVYVYKPAIYQAIEDVAEAEKDVSAIGDPSLNPVTEKNTILDGKLNDRQLESMKAYTDAVEALKNALNDDDKKTCKTTIEAADKVIEIFNKLENKGVTKPHIDAVIVAVDVMCEDIRTNVYGKIEPIKR